jgi:hypothetical protein
MKPSDYRFSRLRELDRFIKKNFPVTKSIQLNSFYSYDYSFKLDPEYEKLKYYCFKPIVYVFRQNKTHCWGVNFEHLPIGARLLWIQKIRKFSKVIAERLSIISFDDQKEFRLPGVNYPALIKVFRKAKIMVRCYRKEAIFNCRRIPLNKFAEVCLYHVSAIYFDVPYKAIEQRYKSYNG